MIPPIRPSTVLLGDIGESDLFPNDFPIKYEPISLATIKKQDVRVKYIPVEFVKFPNEDSESVEDITVDSKALNLIQ